MKSGQAIPLLRVDDAARLLFPRKPQRFGRRQVYRWLAKGLIPAEVLLRDGRGIWLRRGLLVQWLNNGNGKHDV